MTPTTPAWGRLATENDRRGTHYNTRSLAYLSTTTSLDHYTDPPCPPSLHALTISIDDLFPMFLLKYSRTINFCWSRPSSFKESFGR